MSSNSQLEREMNDVTHSRARDEQSPKNEWRETAKAEARDYGDAERAESSSSEELP